VQGHPSKSGWVFRVRLILGLYFWNQRLHLYHGGAFYLCIIRRKGKKKIRRKEPDPSYIKFAEENWWSLEDEGEHSWWRDPSTRYLLDLLYICSGRSGSPRFRCQVPSWSHTWNQINGAWSYFCFNLVRTISFKLRVVSILYFFLPFLNFHSTAPPFLLSHLLSLLLFSC